MQGQLIPFTREQLQKETRDGARKEFLKRIVDQQYTAVLITARKGHTEHFIPFRGQQEWNRYNSGILLTITQEELIAELRKLFPGVTITSIEQKGTANQIYQQAGILFDWS